MGWSPNGFQIIIFRLIIVVEEHSRAPLQQLSLIMVFNCQFPIRENSVATMDVLGRHSLFNPCLELFKQR